MIIRSISFLLVLLNLQGNSQSIWELKDPSGQRVDYSVDSAFIYHTPFEDFLLLFALDDAGMRNVMVTTGKDSYWLFSPGKDPDAEYTPFTPLIGDDVVFRIDSSWYIIENDLTEVRLFHDNLNPSNEYVYSWVFPFDHRLGIVAFERTTGDQVLLLYNPLSPGNIERFRDVNGNDIRVFNDLNISTFQLSDIYLVASIYDVDLGSWSLPGVYEIQAQPKLLLELGVRSRYQIEAFEWFGSYVVDYPDSGPVRMHKYNTSQDTLFDVTAELFDGDEILSAGTIKWPHGSDDVVDRTTDESLWVTKETNGTINYLLRDGGNGFMPEWELEDVQGSVKTDMMITNASFDSIYYYDYDDNTKGLVRLNFTDGGLIKDQTNIPIDQNYELFGWKGRMYYARYDPAQNKLFARYQDFTQGNKNAYLQSSTGQRIENPIAFYPVGELMVVESKNSSGNTFFVYDSTMTTGAAENSIVDRTMRIYPNPSNGLFNVAFSQEIQNGALIQIRICDFAGRIVLDKRMESGTIVNLSNQPQGVYTLYASQNSVPLGQNRIVLVR